MKMKKAMRKRIKIGLLLVISFFAVSMKQTYALNACSGADVPFKSENVVERYGINFNRTGDKTYELKMVPAKNTTERCKVKFKISSINGNAVAADKLPGTGMTLTLASGKKYTVILLGDVDCDGTVSASDARLALRAAVGLEQYGEDTYQHIAANVESNDNLSSSDARLILRAAVGLEKLYVLKKD